MKHGIAAAVTLCLLGGVLWLGRRGDEPDAARPAESPGACIEQMFQAAEQGNVETYLDCFTGQQRQRIERKLTAQTPQQFAQSLAESLRSLKARAIIEPSTDDEALQEAEITVERIYANHNERQTYHLVRESGVWRISAVRAAESLQPPVPYGTPVFAPPTEETAQ